MRSVAWSAVHCALWRQVRGPRRHATGRGRHTRADGFVRAAQQVKF